MSIRLYHDDQYVTSFRARVVSVSRDPSRGEGASYSSDSPYEVALDRTAFYPESGGQPCDLGWIENREVTGVFEREGEVIHNLRSCDGIEPGREVDCRLDAERRRDHMQQHLGQHILSAAFEKIVDAGTVGFHLGSEEVTIDLDIPSLNDSQAHRVEDLTNEVITQDRVVNAVWLSREQALRLPIRKTPERDGPLRIVIVEDFDYSPCGGTHPRRTGEVGLVKVLEWERARAGVRVTFLCGARALRDYRWKNSTIGDIARRFSVSPPEAGAAVARQYDKALALMKTVDRLSAAALDHEAASLVAESAAGAPPGGPVVVARSLSGRSLDELKGLAARITLGKNVIALLSSSVDGGLKVVFARSEDVKEDMSGLMKSTMAMFGGRGGGTAKAAQGGISGYAPGALGNDSGEAGIGQMVISRALGSLRSRP